jgi:phosphoglycolate phosphatase
MLILFDIDGTLLLTRRAGIEAMTAAGGRCFGDGFTSDGVDYAGRLDPLIIRDLFAANAVEASPDAHARFIRAYAEELEMRLAEPGRAWALPGAVDLVERVRAAGWTGSVLTGNLEVSGVMKLRAAGFDPEAFEVRVWGDSSPHDPPTRAHLPRVAMDAHAQRSARAIDPGEVFVIGDTVHDVACAHAHGCRCVAVTTGTFGRAALEAAGADIVLEGLDDVEGVMAWIGQQR